MMGGRLCWVDGYEMLSEALYERWIVVPGGRHETYMYCHHVMFEVWSRGPTSS